ncbi:hypothetical protein COW68_01760 [Candidatus Gracilibacteria bacterium CG18_big_fil_WC_8_21_14_2_50_38_16]|nr:MAG: hypothetical protein COW68_01760 [Candidatus Gracilibacteria bacterium CG18_big_fil_WC_8_21_14_2_50_38_16]
MNIVDNHIFKEIERYYEVNGIFKELLSIIMKGVKLNYITEHQKVEIAESFDTHGYREEKKIYYNFYGETGESIYKKILDVFRIINFDISSLLLNVQDLLSLFNHIKLTIGLTVDKDTVIYKIYFDSIFDQFRGQTSKEDEFLEKVFSLGFNPKDLYKGLNLTHLSLDFKFDLEKHTLLSKSIKTYYQEGRLNGSYMNKIYPFIGNLNHFNEKELLKYKSFHSMIRYSKGIESTNKLYILYDDRKAFVLNLYYIFVFFGLKELFSEYERKILTYSKPEYIGLDFNLEGGLSKIDLYGFL